MQQTEKLKLNLIEMADPFTPDQLNENTKKLEKVLLEELAAKGTCTSVADSYEGDGQYPREFELGFAPKLVFLFGGGSKYSIVFRGGCIYYSDGYYYSTTELTDTGFRLGRHNDPGTTGWYVAFS